MADWQSLPADILGSISERLDYAVDYIRLRSICAPFRSAAPKRPQLPWLIGHHEDNERDRTIFTFFNLNPNQARPPLCPITRLPPAALGFPCYGSSHGWMALLDRTPAITLFNPVTQSRIQLPALIGMFGDKYPRGVDDAIRFWNGEMRFTRAYIKLQPYLANKVVMSSDPAASDCLVVAAYRHMSSLAFCRPGDDAWTPIRGPKQFKFLDVVCYQGCIYAASYQRLYACHVGPEPRIEEIPLLSADEHMPWYSEEVYLVEFNGDSLLAVVNYHFSVQVFKVELREGRMKLLELKSLEGGALFLGRSNSVSVSASAIRGLRGNCVYVANTSGYSMYEQSQIKVFSMEDDSSEIVSYSGSEHQYSGWKPCAWITPSLL